MKFLDKSSQIYSWFSPYSLFLGIILSFILCSVIGRDASHRNLFKGFHRFHLYISPESLYYPTARQLLELSEARIDRSKIAVIVGGSSVLHGVGQSPRDLWTRQLQRDLGSQYKVLNLAFRGGGVQEHGAIAAQMLLQRGYKVIYVSDSIVGGVGTLDYRIAEHRYIFWDAYYKGLLSSYQPRDDYLRKSLPLFSELRLNAQLDSITYANDLWNSIGYEHFFTVWNFIVAGAKPTSPFYQARKKYEDPQRRYKAKPVNERFSDFDANEELTFLRAVCKRYFTIDSAGNPTEVSRWDDIEIDLKLLFSEDFRKRSLITIMHRNPYYSSKISDVEKSCVDRLFALASEKFRLAGYSSIEVGEDFVPDDYFDNVHLVDVGGRKLSKEVAVEVRRMAKELGYEK